MNIRLTLAPGKRGTKRYVEEYGAQLVCVRYRYDAEKGKRYTTVELIVEEGDWQPVLKEPADESIVAIRVVWGEADLARQVRAAGGQWNREKMVWELTYGAVKRLGLLARIVPGEGGGEGVLQAK